MSVDSKKWHGACFGFESEREEWAPPQLAVCSELTARPSGYGGGSVQYDSMSASEYIDTDEVLRAKASAFVGLLKKSKCCVLFTGAGLSTASGIGDYASQAADSLSGVGGSPKAPTSPFLAQPTLAHRVLAALCKTIQVHRWIQQNHDGLPQKAGVPQELMNEIHGSWYAPDNPVIPMAGSLREDLFSDMAACAEAADLSVAIGTSMSGLNADRVAAVPAAKAKKGEALGSVVIALQQTVHDEEATLRVFARCDDFFSVVAEIMALEVAPAFPKGEYFVPPCLQGKSDEELVFHGLPYDASGRRLPPGMAGNLTLDLREDAEIVITNGIHAGACGEVHRFDVERNMDCRLKLKPENPKMKLRAFVACKLGRWWLQAAVDGTAPILPVVNKPASSTAENGGLLLQGLIEEYAK